MAPIAAKYTNGCIASINPAPQRRSEMTSAVVHEQRRPGT
jgi:hypothetical protein